MVERHFSSPARDGIVRLCANHIRQVKVLFRVSFSSVAKGNCVTARWGGEQPKAKDQSVG
jgi:hypothetical protein